MTKSKKALNFNLYTILAVYFLILIGGIVRSMGAGMGCPDWPKCFDAYVPPTNDSGLPEGYEKIYVELREKKNQRLLGVLSSIGFTELAENVRNNVQVNEVTYFDAEKAWVEYLNRLVGVLIGTFIILNMIFSIRYWSVNKMVTMLAIGSFVLVLFQGWVGSLVVSTNLIPGFISFHMVLAILLVVMLLLQRFKMKVNDDIRLKGRYLLISLLFLFGVQILLGIQVREQIDLIHFTTNLTRDLWIKHLGSEFYIHRSYSILLSGLIGYVLYINYKNNSMNGWLYLLGAVVALEIILGAVLSYFSLPAFIQPLHLLLATVAFGAIFYLFLSTNYRSKLD